MRQFRGINFGDSPQVVKATMLNDSAFDISYPPDLNLRDDDSNAMWQRFLNLSTPVVPIGDRSYRVGFYFYDGQLYRVEFQSHSYDADHLDNEVKQARDNLVGVIKGAHGLPDVHRDLGFLDTKSRRVVWSDTWNAKTDGVSYKIGIGESDSTFYATLWVQYVPLLNQYIESLQEEQSAAQMKSASDF